MNYVGRLLSNFKGFYNEINSATLTGAIDVVVVQQADGSLISSPFHVRFGKMGVLRSREKIVDIEINGHPVDLHMKLGEQGEAFFVHGAEDSASFPAHLATSPIPEPMSLMEAGIREMKIHQESHIVDPQTVSTVAMPEDDPTLIDPERTPTESFPKEDSIGSFISLSKKDSQQSIYQSNQTSFECTAEADQVVSETTTALSTGEVSPGNVSLTLPATSGTAEAKSKTDSAGSKMDIAVQTDVTGCDVELQIVNKELHGPLSPKSSSDESRYEDQDRSSRGTLTKYTAFDQDKKDRSHTVVEMSQDVQVSVKQKSSSDIGSPLSQSVPRLIQTRSQDTVITVSSPDESQISVDAHNQRRKRRKKLVKKKEILRQKINSSSSATRPNEEDSGSSLDGYAQDQEMFDMELSETDELDNVLYSMGRTISMPIIEDRDLLTKEWASSQYASAFHPFSDGDITPIVSPIGSRPPSPKSDTEFEIMKSDAIVQTQLTGDDYHREDDVQWKWGELPESSSRVPAEETREKETEDKPSSGLFRFMRQTKKIRHKPQEEGIYLDELNLEEMDPEVVALYLSHPKGGNHSLRTIQDEDSESGRGASLPQSPVSMMSESQSQKDMPNVAMSLCGGLKESEGDIAHARFMQNLVTFDEFVENPDITSNPDLVIRMGEKYYNWQIAGPMLMAAVAFERPLPEYAVDTLIKQHMPKKEQRRRGWIWWRTVEDNTATIEKQDTTTPPASPSSSVPNSPAKPTRRHTVPNVYSTGEDSDKEDQNLSQMDENMELASHELYKKSLKLTSEELMKLSLQEGRNEISFSVTTAYQGTCRCSAFIYLWKWDDRIVVSDIDGTITKSDVLGQLLPMVGKDWSQAGITHLYSMIHRNGYKFVYLSARAIGQAKITRDYLRSVRQGDKPLPEGPLLLSPSSLISAFHREVIEKKPEEFKISCLRDIAALFPLTRNPFYAGYGNKINDVWAYRAVGIPISRIFTVNHKGELRLEQSHTFMSSYTKLSDVVDHFFPPMAERPKNKGILVQSSNFHSPDEYSSFTYWREPLPDVELELETLRATDLDKR